MNAPNNKIEAHKKIRNSSLRPKTQVLDPEIAPDPRTKTPRNSAQLLSVSLYKATLWHTLAPTHTNPPAMLGSMHSLRTIL